MIYLNKEFEDTQKHEIFDDILIASEITGIHKSTIYMITSKKPTQLTARHKKNQKIITFIKEPTSKEKIKEHIARIKTSRPIVMIYIDEKEEETEECEVFNNIKYAASRITGISEGEILNILNKKQKFAIHKYSERKVIFKRI